MKERQPSKMGHAIRAYLHKALPRGQGRHFLMLGEQHDRPQHHAFLTEHMETLRDACGVRTLSLEIAPHEEIFFWAYRDRKLPVLSGQERQFMLNIMGAISPVWSKESGTTMALEALDAGMDVIGIDTRRNLAGMLHAYAKHFRYIEGLLDADPVLLQRLRTEPQALQRWAKGEAHFGPSPCPRLRVRKKLAEFYNFLSKDEIKVVLLQGLYVLYEIRCMHEANPDYRERFHRIVDLEWLGYDAGVREDSLSAVMLASRATPEGNAIHIGGLNHMLGSAAKDPQLGIQGTLADTLADMGLPVRVAMITDSEHFRYLNEEIFGDPEFQDTHHWQRHPSQTSYIPDILITDRHRVIQPRRNAGEKLPGSKVRNVTVQRFIQSGEMQAGLSAIRRG